MAVSPTVRFDYDLAALRDLVIADLKSKGYTVTADEVKVSIKDSTPYLSPGDAGEAAKVSISFETNRLPNYIMDMGDTR